MPIIERDVVLQGVDENGQPTIDLPITRLGNIEDTAEIKAAPAEGDYVPIIDGADGDQMKKTPWTSMGGTDGESAYQIAVDYGFTGTEEEWLASLKGADGADGTNGADGQDGATGPAGPGVAAGGTAGQMLAKNSNADYDTKWVDPPQSGVTSFNGRTGAVAPQAGDYTAEQVGAVPKTGGTFTGSLAVAPPEGLNPSIYLKTATEASGSKLVFNHAHAQNTILIQHVSAGTKIPSTVRVGGLDAPVTDDDAVNKGYFDTHAFTIASNAGAHNSIFRGKNLGTSVTAAQYAAIAAGTFDDLFIGDYWVIGGVNWRIAAFDYFLGTGVNQTVSQHHVTIVPDTRLYDGVMNDTATTSGGYKGSKMWQEGLDTARTRISSAFQYRLNHKQRLSNAMKNGKVTGMVNVLDTVVLMSERNVYGQSIMSSECNDGSGSPVWGTYNRGQFPLFALAPEFINKERESFWLLDLVSVSQFAMVIGNGYPEYAEANAAMGVRPFFSITGAS